MRELLARINAALRRDRWPAQHIAGVLAVGDLRIDLHRRAVLVGAHEIPLRGKQLQLLALLARHPGQVLTRKQIMRHVWGVDEAPGNRTIDVHMTWLREKLGEEPGRPRRLQTIRNVGYRLAG